MKFRFAFVLPGLAVGAIGAIGGMVAGAAPGFAQSIELAALEQEALSASPALAEALARRDAASSLAGGAGVSGDPTLELWARNLFPDSSGGSDGAGDSTWLEVEVAQPVRFPGKREAVRELARAELALAEAVVEQTRRRLLVDVRTAFARLGAADQEQRSLAEAHELLELITAIAQSRFGAARDGALAVIESELAIDEHDLEVDKVFARFLGERARLAALAGLESQSLPLLVGTRPEPVFPASRGTLPIDPEAPRIAVSRLEERVAERRLELAKLGLRPDFRLGGGFSWPDGDDPRITALAGMELPFFRRRREAPRIAAAESALAAARAGVRGAELAASADAARWSAELDRLDRALARLSGSVIPRLSAALEAARIGFLSDELPFDRLLNLYNDWFHARVELAQAEAERFALWAEWQELAVPEAKAPEPAPASQKTPEESPTEPAAESPADPPADPPTDPDTEEDSK